MLRFDGYYFHEVNEEGYLSHYQFLRFFPGKKVVGCSVSKNNENLREIISQVKVWLNEDYLAFQGEYELNQDDISFFIKSEYGSVGYKGKVGNDSLVLSSISYINGNKTDNIEYGFVPLDIEKVVEEEIEGEIDNLSDKIINIHKK